MKETATRVEVAAGGSRLYSALQTAVVLIFLASISLLARVGHASFIQFALVGSFLALVASRPPLARILEVLGAAAGFAVVYFAGGGSAASSTGGWLAVPAAFCGVGAIAVLSGESIWLPAPMSVAQRQLVYTIILTPALCVVSAVAISAASGFLPKTDDLFLYWFDQGLGAQPSFAVGRWMAQSGLLAQTCGAIYNMLPVWMTAAFVLQFLRGRRGLDDVRMVSIWLGIAGFCLYFICPAAGPIHYALQAFPWNEPRVAAEAIMAIPIEAVPRNAMPSLHAGWALLLFYQSWRWGLAWVGLFATVLVFTLLATLGSGEHYLIDLAVSTPLVLAVYAWTAGREHRAAAIFGAVLAIAWPVSLQSSLWLTHSLAIGWSLAALTVVASVALSVRVMLARRPTS